MASITINEGSGADLKELIELQKEMLECLMSQQRLLAGIAAVLAKVVGDANEVDPEAAFVPTSRAPSPTVGQNVVPLRPPVPPPTFVDEPIKAEEKIIYSEDYATDEEAGVLTQTEEQREQIDMEASLRALGIEIDDASIPFPGAEHNIGDV